MVRYWSGRCSGLTYPVGAGRSYWKPLVMDRTPVSMLTAEQ